MGFHYLQVLELLPTDCQTESPDDQCPDTVEDHPGGGTELLGHRDASKVEKGDGENCQEEGEEEEPAVKQLVESVDGILQVVRGHWGVAPVQGVCGDEGEPNQHADHQYEAEETCYKISLTITNCYISETSSDPNIRVHAPIFFELKF